MSSTNHLRFDISKVDTNLLKGIGILMIVIHNFLHNVNPLIGENEFSFSLHITQKYLDAVAIFPQEFLRANFSFFGHYGVQLFVFLSAYGLTKAYFNKAIKYHGFVRSRFIKVYLTFLLCLAMYLCFGVLKVVFLSPTEQVFVWDAILYKVLLISNFVPGEGITPVGPWWFLPFIMQFYLVFPAMLLIFRKYGVPSLLMMAALGFALEIIFSAPLQDIGLNINYTFLGHMSVFCIGMYFAMHGLKVNKYIVFLLSLAGFVASMFYQTAWYFSDLTVTLVLLILCLPILQKLKQGGVFYKTLSFYGSISFPLFLVNGFLRSPFLNFADRYETWFAYVIAAFVSLAFSTFVALILDFTDKKTRYFVGKKIGNQ